MLRHISHSVLRTVRAHVAQTVVVCLALFGTAAPAHASIAVPAQASSLVFVAPDGNVWLAKPDGTGQLRITSHGTALNPYFSPTESTRQTIEVARGKGAAGELLRISLSGKRLNALTRPGVTIVGPQISPDGSHVAFSTFANGEPCYALTDASHTPFCVDVVSATVATKPALTGWMNFEYPAWIGSSRLLLFDDSGTLYYADTSKGGYETWFNWLDYFKAGTDGFGEWISGAASANGERLALLTHVDNKARFVIQLFSGATNARTGDLTAYVPSLSRCQLTAPDGGNGADPKHRDLPAFNSISFSPDGRSIAFGFKGAVYVTHLGSLTDCAQISTRRVIKAGLDPHFGAA